MTFIAFVGATRYEAQIGRLWITVARPRFWVWKLFPWIKVGIEKKEDQ